MKFPSFSYLFINAKTTFLRFPLMMVSSIIAVAIGIYAIECRESTKNYFPFINLILASSIGIPLFFSASILSVKNNYNKKTSTLISIFVTALLVLIYFSLPNKASTHNINQPYIKYAIYNLAAHLLVSFIPFLAKNQLNGFWQYNRILFTRIITAAVFSGALFLGLSLAITAVNVLFEIKLHEELYFELLLITGGIFNTWFFANGIPNEFEALEEMSIYPKPLKIFTQYILLPLLGLYLIILYLYGGKIMIDWNWPKGVVSYLIICIAVLGILTFLLLYPFGKLKESEWIKKSERLFYTSLLPLQAILFIAILMRIDDYGITINRYIVLALGIWLSVVSIFTLILKTNIKFIPISLAVVLICSSFGPWSIFAVSERYQVKRLQTILEKNNILVNGKIVNETKWRNDSLLNFDEIVTFQNNKQLNDSLRFEVKSILDYLDDYHGFSKIQPWFNQNINQLVNKSIEIKKDPESINEAYVYMKTIGLDYNDADKDIYTSTAYYNTIEDKNADAISGYDYEVSFNSNFTDESLTTISQFNIDSTNFLLSFRNDLANVLDLQYQGEYIKFELNSLIQLLKNKYGKAGNGSMPKSVMQLTSEDKRFKATIKIQSIEVEKKKNNFVVNSISGKLLIGLK